MNLRTRYLGEGADLADPRPLDEEKMLNWLRYWSTPPVIKPGVSALSFDGWDAGLSISAWWWLSAESKQRQLFLQFCGCATLGGRLRSLNSEQWSLVSKGLSRRFWKWALIRLDQSANDGLALPSLDEPQPSADHVFALAAQQLKYLLDKNYPKTSQRVFSDASLAKATQLGLPRQLQSHASLSIFSEADWVGAAEFFFSVPTYFEE
jgi:hypothetical protein